MAARRFTDLRAWQACDLLKKATYVLCRSGSLSRDVKLRSQLEDAVAGPPRNIAEGFGRFNPADFNRFVVMARASLMETQNHLRDAVDKGHINENVRLEHDRLAETALQQTTGLMEYLQSSEALTNARRARERRIHERELRRTEREPEPRSEKSEG